MNVFIFFNDTGKEVKIHPATEIHGCTCEMTPIKPLEERVFHLPEETVAWVKMWDYDTYLSILVSPRMIQKKD